MTMPSTALTVAAQMERMPVGRTHVKVMIAVGLGLFFEIYELFLGGVISVGLKDEWAVSGTQLKLFLASTFVGMFFGAAFMGSLADRIGRKRAFTVNLVWFSFWSLAAAFAPDPWFLIVARFLAGVGVGAEYPVVDTYLADILPKDKRGKLATATYTFGFAAVPALGFLSMWLTEESPLNIAGWRLVLGLGALGAIVIVFMRRSVPESPRWLEQMGRHEEARRALQRFADGSGVDIAPVKHAQLEATDDTVSAAGKPPRGILRQAPYRSRIKMMAIFQLMQTFGYYGFGTMAALVLVDRGFDVTSSLMFVALSFFGYPIGSLLSIPLAAKVERKFLLVGSLLVLAVFGLVFASAASNVTIVLSGLMVTLVGQVYSNTFHIYQAEIFPTSIRGTAVGWTYSLSRLTSAALPFILLPVLYSVGATAMFSVVTAALLVAAGVVLTIGPRTSNRSLEEINPVRAATTAG